MVEGQVDDMQNQVLKTLEKKAQAQDERIQKLEIQFSEVLARMDLIIKGIKWIAGAVALGLGIDAHGFMEV